MKPVIMSVEEARAAGFLPKKAVGLNSGIAKLVEGAKAETDEKPRSKRRQNKTEQAYDFYLKSLVENKRIIKYGFESITLKLADDLRYSPDFYILCLDGSIQFHDTKGNNKKKKTYYSRTVGINKIKMAAEQYPEFKFYVVWKDGFNWRWKLFSYETVKPKSN